MNTVLIVKLGSTYPQLIARQGDFDDWVVRRLNLPAGSITVVDVPTGQTLPTDGFCGAIITGSHKMVTDKLNWSENTADWLRQQIDRRKPVFGICYGHQLLCHALGGVVGPNPRGKEFGNQKIHLNNDAETDSLFNTMPKVFEAHCCHAQSALELPPGAVCLGGNPHEPNHAIRFAENCWGVQFHPEFDADATRYYIRQYKDMLSHQGIDARKLSEAVCPSPQSYALITRFAQHAMNY
jgi:GMP synthase (glutamine-hydrolysing)